MHDFTSLHMQMVQCNAWLHFIAHANSAMQCMTSLLPTNPNEGSEGCNHIAIPQRVLLYWYLPHHSGYGFFICIFNMRVQKYDCNAWTSYTAKIYNSKSNPQVDKHINPQIKQKSDLIWLVWASEINGGNSNNKVKASRPHRYVYLPSPKIKNVS